MSVGPLKIVALILVLAHPASTTVAAEAPAVPSAHPNLRPGDDFFTYANGTWLAASEIPAGQQRWSARNEIDERTRQQIVQLLDDASTAPPGSLERKVGDFHTAWLNADAIEARGIRSLQPQLDRIAAIQDRARLIRVLGGAVRADVDPLNWAVYDSANLFGLAVQPGPKSEKTHQAFLLQGGLRLPSREHYIATSLEMLTLRKQYQQYIGRTLALAGFDHPAQRAEAVLALETAIAQTHFTPEQSADERNTENVWTRADFLREAPGTDWAQFFEAAGLSHRESFVVWQPGSVTGAARLIASQPLAAWRDYLRFHLIDQNADVLPREFSQQAFAFRETYLASTSDEQRARQATERTMSEALGRLYVERHFSPEAKARMLAIAANVIAAFRQRVEAVGWMSPTTKARALEKLDALYFGVGYPERWPDHSKLVVSSQDAIGNVERVSAWNYANALARLGQPVDMKEWRIAPHIVGAVLLFEQNAYNFPAALLQAPKFNPTASDATNYGAIGAIVGHEVSHFVDTLGAQYDAAGRKTHWWTPEDTARYSDAVAPLVKQFSLYRPFADAAVDGQRTLVENLADLGGLAAAFDAYRRTLGSRAGDEEYVRQQDREFFLGFAQSWRGKMRDEALRSYLADDTHAPERYRIATVRNLDAWYAAFGVRPGDVLYLEPEARVRIW